MTEKRTRTPRPHVFRITAGDGLDNLDTYVEAHSLTQAKAWFVEHRLRVDEVTPREIHEAGQDGATLFSAIGGEPVDPSTDEAELFGPRAGDNSTSATGDE